MRKFKEGKVEKMGQFLFFDSEGNAVGIGEKTRVTTEINSSAKKREAVQTIIAANGYHAAREQKIDEATAKDIRDPSKKLSLSDFKIKKA